MTTKGAKKADTIVDGVKMSKVRLPYLLAHAKELVAAGAAINVSDGVTPEVLVHDVAIYYAGMPVDDQGECGVCKGIGLLANPRCPYCTADAEDKQLPEDVAPKAVAKEAAKEEKPARALAVVPKAAIVKDDLKTSSSLITERELDDQVRKVHKLTAEGAQNYWELGRAVKVLFDTNMWKLRVTPEDGKPRWKTWDAFVMHELNMTPPHAFNAIDVCAKHTVDEITAIGATKLSIVLRAPPEDQAEMLRRAKEKGVGVRELRNEVAHIKKEKNFTRPSRTGAKAPKEAGLGGRKGGEGKITIAAIVGRKTVKLYKKPAKRDWEKKDLVPTRKIGDVPFGQMELANNVMMTFTLVVSAAGDWQIVVETKREKETE